MARYVVMLRQSLGPAQRTTLDVLEGLTRLRGEYTVVRAESGKPGRVVIDLPETMVEILRQFYFVFDLEPVWSEV